MRIFQFSPREILIVVFSCVSVATLTACTTPERATSTSTSSTPVPTSTSPALTPTTVATRTDAQASPTVAVDATATPVSTPTPSGPARVGSGLSPTPTSTAPVVTTSDTIITDLRDVEGGLLIGADGTQLAVLLATNQSADSVCGEAGSPFGETSILNDASQYGGAFGANSPFNPDSIAPPAIVLDGQVIGHLSVSAFVSSPVDPYSVLDWLGCPLLRG